LDKQNFRRIGTAVLSEVMQTFIVSDNELLMVLNGNVAILIGLGDIFLKNTKVITIFGEGVWGIPFDRRWFKKVEAVCRNGF
jgi:hypothetical protein